MDKKNLQCRGDCAWLISVLKLKDISLYNSYILSSKNSDPEYVDICSVLEQPDVRTLSRVGFSSVYHLTFTNLTISVITEICKLIFYP